MLKQNNLGATHVEMSDNISDNATNIVEGATHVDMSDNISDSVTKLVEGATHVDLFDNVSDNATNFDKGATHVETPCPPLEGGPNSLISRWGNTSEGVNDYAIADQVRNDGNNFLPLLGEDRRGIDFTKDHYPPQPSLIREGGATYVVMPDNISDIATKIVNGSTHLDHYPPKFSVRRT